RPGQISPSLTSLICTTVPSAGERMSTWRSEPRRCGSRKKLKRNAARRPNTIAAVHHVRRSAAAVRMITGMMNSHPSGANRIFGMGGCYAKTRQKAESRGQKSFTRETLLPTASAFCLLLRYVAGFVCPNSFCHLIFEVQLALFQRLLFHLFLDGHLRLGGE